MLEFSTGRRKLLQHHQGQGKKEAGRSLSKAKVFPEGTTTPCCRISSAKYDMEGGG